MALDLTRDNAAGYLGARGIVTDGVTELGGGVSNTVLLADTSAGRIVLKQALGRLRVEQDWRSDPARALREAGALRALAVHLPPGALPAVVFIDETNRIFAMTAAPAGAECWKDQLLRGDVRPQTAARCGALLASMWRASWRQPEMEAAFGDQTVFDQLRLDPYYRSTALRHPDLAAHFEARIEDCRTRRLALVHGDWSPKNFLASPAELCAIDFEVIHFGDPSFDAGFLLNHLFMKALRRPPDRDRLRESAQAFWSEIAAGLPEPSPWLEAATLRHQAALLLARVDGKSPAEYLREPATQERVRTLARGLILRPPSSIPHLFEHV